jgi:hypothetical protein
LISASRGENYIEAPRREMSRQARIEVIFIHVNYTLCFSAIWIPHWQLS